MTQPVSRGLLVPRAELLASLPKQRLWRHASVAGLLFGLALFGLWRLGFSFEQFVAGLGKLGLVVSLMIPPDPGPRTLTFLHALGETLAIAFLGTAIAAVMALPLAMLAAKNVVANRIVHFLARRSLDTIRSIDALIWALIFINVVGLGPFAGILAIAVSDIGSFGKLFSEAIEGADKRPVEGVVAAGGSRLEAFRFGMFPQVLPVMASQVLYYFESNTRSATIIGIVGAGGIGLYLANEIQQAEWQKVAFIILMILVTVAIIDWVSSRLRFAIIGKTATAH
jgi:phosphonate transport system permease protein